MSDDNSVGGGLKDLGSETLKQVVSIPKSMVKGAIKQAANTDSEELEAQKKADQAATFQRVKEIDAEMASIRQQNEQKTGPEIQSSDNNINELNNNQSRKTDEASRQAIGRAEQGRNFKG